MAKFDPSRSGNAQLVYSTYLGGSGATINGVLTGDEGHAIAVDGLGDAYVTGSATSTDFPVNGLYPPLQASLAGGTGDTDAFVAKLGTSGEYLVFSTYLGGSLADSGQAIALDDNSNFYVTGYTFSMPNNFAATHFPTTATALPEDWNLGNFYVTGAFLTEYKANPTGMVQSTLFSSPGALGSILGTGVAVDHTGNVLLTGETQASDMPITTGAHQATLKGSSDAFLAKIWPISITDSDNVLPAVLNFGSINLNSISPAHTITVASNSTTLFSMTKPTLGGSYPGSYQMATNCLGEFNGPQSCTISVTFSPANGGDYPATISFTLTDDDGLQKEIEIPLNGTGSGLIVNPNPVNFPSTAVGTSFGILVSITDPTTAALTIESLTFSNPAFVVGRGSSCKPGEALSNGGGCELNVVFEPSTAVIPTTGTLTITSLKGRARSTQTVNLSGLGTGLDLTPNYALFPDADVSGVPTFLNIVATNTSSIPATFTAWNIPTGAGFNVDARKSSCRIAVALAAGQSCYFKIYFAPGKVAAYTSEFTATYTSGAAPVTLTASLIGSGVAPVALIQPSTLTFTGQAIKTSSAANLVLVTNTGAFPLTLSAFTVPANSGYSVAPLGSGTTCSTAVTLQAQTSSTTGGFCSIGVIFSPTATGTVKSMLTITDNSGGAPGATQLVSLTGTAVLPTAATPVFTPLTGIYTAAQNVTIADATTGATIYYTTNGTTPSASSTKYTGVAIKVSATTTIQAVAIASGYLPSLVNTAKVTIATAPSVVSSAATSISTPKATLNATVTPNNATTQYWFAYGTSKTALTSTTPKTGSLTGTQATPVNTALTTLKTKTIYYFQVVASNAVGTTSGAILSFTTN